MFFCIKIPTDVYPVRRRCDAVVAAAATACSLVDVLPSSRRYAMAQFAAWQERLFGKHFLRYEHSDFITVSVAEALSNVQVTGIYFSFANISQQSDDFVKKLRTLYQRLNDENCEVKKLEVVQVVLWANNDVFNDFENSHRESLVGMPWLAVPFSEIELKV